MRAVCVRVYASMWCVYVQIACVCVCVCVRMLVCGVCMCKLHACCVHIWCVSALCDCVHMCVLCMFDTASKGARFSSGVIAP